MKKLVKLDTHKLLQKYDFYDKCIEEKFYSSKNNYLTVIYLHLIDDKIVSFCMLMEESLEFSFLDYHIPKYKKYFIISYPQIAKKTNHIHYIYTAIQYFKL